MELIAAAFVAIGEEKKKGFVLFCFRPVKHNR